MVCTGTPNLCQCKGKCPMLAARARGDEFTPMNQAARDAMDKQGEPYDRKASERLERFFGLDKQ